MKFSTKAITFLLSTIIFFCAGFSSAYAATLYYKDTQMTPDYAWDTIVNWWTNSGHTIPAGALPTTGDTVYVDGDIYSGPSTLVTLAYIHVGSLTMPTFCSITGAIGNATFYNGTYHFGTVDGDAVFNGGNNGAMSTVTGNATFNSGGNNMGTVQGDAIFNDTSENGAGRAVEGGATFNDSSINYGTVDQITSTHTVTFNDSSQNGSGGVASSCIFNHNSINKGMCFSNTVLNGNSYIDTTGEVSFGGSATFNDYSYNNSSNLVAGSGSFFYDYTSNEGTIVNDATFYEFAVNNGTVNGTYTYLGFNTIDSNSLVVTLNVTAGIAIDSPSDISMSRHLSLSNMTAIASSTWTVSTNNVTGYSLTIKASTAPAMQQNATTTVADYTVGTPSLWSVSAGTAMFGFSAYGTDVNTTNWGTDSSCQSTDHVPSTSLKYSGFTTSTSSPIVATRTSTTSYSGVPTTVCFAVEQDAFYIPSGTYTATITATAVTI